MNRESINFYTTGGTLSHDAPSYVERQADRDLLDGLRGGEFCYVLTSRQMGKSSLMVRTANKLREGGVQVIALDLTAVGQNVTAEQWYDGLLNQMGRQVRLEDALDEFWLAHDRLGPCQRFFASIRDVVLSKRTEAVVIFVDEIDTVRSLPFSTDEFFAAIRECHNRRGQDPAFLRVTFCLLGVATPSDLIRDTRTTPFNIGRRIELDDFAEEEAAPLAQGLRHALAREAAAKPGGRAASDQASAREVKRLIKRVFYWTGGHPYLTQRFCRAVAEAGSVRHAAGVDQIGENLFFTHRAKERDDNLLFVRDRLLRGETDLPSLLELYSKVRRGERVDDEETSRQGSILRLSGIVKSVRGTLKPRNRIYSRVFDRRWVDAHMPDAELHRQRAAFYRGVIRTSSFAGVVVTALGLAALIAVWQATKARKALARAYYSQAQAGRASGRAGQRYESLEAIHAARAAHTSQDDLRDEAIACLALVDLKEETNAVPTEARTNVVDFVPGRDLAAVAQPDGLIVVERWPEKIQVARLPGLGGRLSALRFSPGGDLLAASYVGSETNRFTLWNWQQARELFSSPHGAEPAAIDFSADGRKLAVGCADGRIRFYKLPGGEPWPDLEMRLHSGSPRLPQTIRFNPTGDWIAVCSPDDQYAEIWSLEPQQRLAALYHRGEVLDLSWHPLGHTLATACNDSHVYLWATDDFQNPKNYASVTKLSAHENRVRAVTFNHRGTLLASLGEDETLRLWVPGTGRQVSRSLPGTAFDQLHFSADDRHLAVLGGGGKNPRVYRTFGDELVILRLQGGNGDEVRTIDFSPDNRWLLAATARQITLWDPARGAEVRGVTFGNSQSAWFTGDSAHFVASSDRGLFRFPVLEVPGPGEGQGAEFERLFGQEGLDALGPMSFSLDRTKAVVARQEKVVLITTEPGVAQPLHTEHLGVYYPHLSLHPKGTWLAAHSGESNVLHLWDLTQMAATTTPASVPGSKYFAFSPDGQWLGTYSDGAFQCYRVGDWQRPACSIPRQFASGQHAPVAFARDGRTIAVASTSYAIQLYRLPLTASQRPELVATLESPDRLPLELLAFSADGRRLAAATDRQLVELWDLSLIRRELAKLELVLRPPWPDQPAAPSTNGQPTDTRND